MAIIRQGYQGVADADAVVLPVMDFRWQAKLFNGYKRHIATAWTPT